MVGIGPVAPDLAGLADARACTDRALRVLREAAASAGSPAWTTSRSRR